MRLIPRFWPQAVFEDATTGEKVDRYESLPIGLLGELFVYRDSEAARGWEERGGAPSLSNTMIHLLHSDEALTIVVDDVNDEAMSNLLQSVRRVLQMDILNLPAERSAA